MTLVGRVLDVEPEGLACLNELRYQRRGGLPDDLAGVINPAPHGSRLRHSVSSHSDRYCARCKGTNLPLSWPGGRI